jgi:ATP-dependent DNA helicase RecG
LSGDEAALLHFCETPRTRKELAEYLGLDSVSYAIKRHVMPLVELGLLRMELPDTPKSPRQRFVRVL